MNIFIVIILIFFSLTCKMKKYAFGIFIFGLNKPWHFLWETIGKVISIITQLNISALYGAVRLGVPAWQTRIYPGLQFEPLTSPAPWEKSAGKIQEMYKLCFGGKSHLWEVIQRFWWDMGRASSLVGIFCSLDCNTNIGNLINFYYRAIYELQDMRCSHITWLLRERRMLIITNQYRQWNKVDRKEYNTKFLSG